MCTPRWSSVTPRRRCCSTPATSWRAFSPWRSSTARSATSTRCAIPTSSRPSLPHAKSAAAEISAKLGGVRTDRLGDLGSPHEVLRAVGDATNRLDLPPPAALTGEWFGAAAVIAPSLAVRPVDVADAFEVQFGSPQSPAVGGGWFGYLSYPDAGADGRDHRVPEAAGGWSDCVLPR